GVGHSRSVWCDDFLVSRCCLFFFQAEDGIRDWSVTGVQTCALPICRKYRGTPPRALAGALDRSSSDCCDRRPSSLSGTESPRNRSEERRVGKECRSRGASVQ